MVPTPKTDELTIAYTKRTKLICTQIIKFNASISKVYRENGMMERQKKKEKGRWKEKILHQVLICTYTYMYNVEPSICPSVRPFVSPCSLVCVRKKTLYQIG